MNKVKKKEPKIEFKAEDFPTEATIENIESLVKKANDIEKSKTKNAEEKLFLLQGFSYLIVWTAGWAGFLFIALILLLFWFKAIPAHGFTPLENQLLNFSAEFVILVGVMMIAFALYYRKSLHLRLLYRFFKYPRPRYEVFSLLAQIAEKLTNGERIEATKIFRNLRDALTRYLLMIGSIEENLASCINVLTSRFPLRNLILFSEDDDLPLLFLNVGLAIIHDDFPRIYSLTNQIQNSYDYRKEEPSRFSGMLDFLQVYEKPISLLFKIAVFIITLIVLYYLRIFPTNLG